MNILKCWRCPICHISSNEIEETRATKIQLVCPFTKEELVIEKCPEGFRDSLKFDVVKILDDNGLDSTVDGFSKEVTMLTNEQKEEIADKIIRHVWHGGN